MNRTKGTDRVTIEEIIGWRMKYRRNHLDLTQKEVGQRLEEHLGKAWSPQAVSIAENGGRDFRARDLVALARVLQTTPNFLTDWDSAMDADTLSRLQSLYRDLTRARIHLDAAHRWLQSGYRDPETGDILIDIDSEKAEEE
jgi:transcriptional regulator with XRE-family HTH domain